MRSDAASGRGAPIGKTVTDAGEGIGLTAPTEEGRNESHVDTL